MTEATQAAVDIQPKRYPLTQTEFEVQISVGGKTLSHKLRRPTLAELVTRESESVTEVEEVSPGEDAFHVEDKAATARLWDKIRLQVKGYRTGDAKPDEWIDVTPELAAKLPADHKVAAVRALYLFRVEMVEDEGDGFDLDGQEYDIRQLIGGDEDAPEYVIVHRLRQPTEQQRRDYERRASATTFSTGTKKRKMKFRANLKADVELYDALFVSLTGATPPDKGAVDPIVKRQVVQCLLGKISASVLD